MSSARPRGIGVLSLLFALNVAIYAALFALALWWPGTLRSVLRALSPSGAGPEDLHRSMAGLLPAYYAIAAVATAALAVGFWRLWNWARVIVLALLALSAVGLVAECVHLFRAPTAAGVALTLFRTALMVLVAWYLTSPKVRAAFRPAAAA